MSKVSKNKRRATVLILVVSLLALLFVLVTGFISMARVDRQTIAAVSEAEVTDQILDSLDDQVESLVAGQLVGQEGAVLAGGAEQSYSAEDIPGYRQSNYLASLEPVWQGGVVPSAHLASGSWGIVERLVWPAVTSLDPTVEKPVARPLFRLMPESDKDNDTTFTITDVLRYARSPILDADGDGIPDASFVLSGPATEMANRIAGVSVSLPGYNKSNPFNISGIPAPNVGPLYNYEKWRRFQETARYVAAVRVVSHGGMVALDSPTLYTRSGARVTPFNRGFVVDLFDAIRNGYDQPLATLYPHGSIQQDRIFTEISMAASAIESQLRRRFLLPPRAELENHRPVRKSPPILAELQGELMSATGFPKTFIPSFRSGLEVFGTPQNWQRINIGIQGSANEDERAGWAQAVSLDATAFDTYTGTALLSLERKYDRRHLLTTVNNSDEIARKQTPGDPNKPFELDSTGKRGSTFEGELKFYLGEVGKAFVAINGGLDYAYDPVRGRPIIEHLARMYFDMLGGHSKRATSTADDDWDDLFGPSSTGKEAVSRRQQALMLAVNTVAFAAPRDPAGGVRQEGAIDVVYYDDGGTEYAGYAPQPFFSEVIAYTTPEDPNDPNDSGEKNAELAVELYNPHTPFYFDPGTGIPVDGYAIPLAQFAVSANNANPNTEPEANGGWKRLNFAAPNDYIAGRSFKTIIVENIGQNPNDYFQNQNGSWPVVAVDIEPPSGGGGLQGTQTTLWLWRQGSSGRWVPIDRIDIRLPVPRSGGVWKATHRDTSPAFYLGLADLNHDGSIDGNPAPNGEDTDGDAVADTFARWNVATPITQTASGSGAPNTLTLDSPKWLTGSGAGMAVDPDAAMGMQFAPTTPFMTMNAGPVGTFGPNGELYDALTSLPMFGSTADLRPRSFPTVGFLLYVPRFSHVWKPGVTENIERYWKPMSWVLRRQWSSRGHTVSAYPADFGHMPVFDNKQSAPSGSYFHASSGVGKVPWGLLVFDYFTTINPIMDRNADGAPDVDPLRIPGRININAAPWYVLANLPVLGPNSAGELPLRVNPGGNLTLSDPYPSFWDPGANMLVDSYSAGAAGTNPHTGTRQYRLLMNQGGYAHSGQDLPWIIANDRPLGRWRLGPWLAQSAAAYRDGVQYVDFNPAFVNRVFAYSQLRNATNGSVRSTSGGLVPFSVPYRNSGIYGSSASDIRGTPSGSGASGPTEFGFVTVGELLNVKGFDSTPPGELPPLAPADATALGIGDYIKAVSLLVLLDSQYLTTRSNTFTIYTSVIDRENPQKSMRSQTTIDRSNLLPQLQYAFQDPGTGTYYPLSNPANIQNPAIRALPLVPLMLDLYGTGGAPPVDGIPDTPVRFDSTERLPRVIASRRVGYFDARNDN